MKAKPTQRRVDVRHDQSERTDQSSGGESGFTFTELLVVLGMLALLALLAVPVLANGKAGSQRAVCAGNLARVGRALATWGAERGDLYPWQAQASLGGTFNHPSGLNNNIWFQFSWVSNELATPRILACPSDRLVKVAENFGLGPEGLLNNQYQNRAISYTLSHPYPEDGRLVLSTDRNVIFGAGLGSGCSYFGDGPIAEFGLPQHNGWGTFMHVNSGNLLFNDGSVEQTNNDGLRRAIDPYFRPESSSDRQSRPHFLVPRSPNQVSESDN
jgi:prepilin-type N-terminal cleavage/methylation domain-containing protein/prepilin-type processing-associated H-X9-DG protein